MKRAISGLLVLAAVSSAADASASPGASSGFGSRSRALAGASVAGTRGPASVFENPAGLVRSRDTELSVGFAWTGYDLTFDGRDAPLDDVPELAFGLVVPGAILTLPVVFGLDLSLPDGRYSKLGNADPRVPYFPLDDSGPRLLDLGMALAIRPAEWLSLGGGVGFLAAARGGFRVTGTAVAADGSGSEYESRLRHAVDADLVAVRYPLLGLTVEAMEELTLGLAFRGPVTIEQRLFGELAGAARVGETDIPVRYDFETRAALAFLPAKVALGATVRPAASLLVHVELDWEAWSGYPTPYARASARLEADPPPGIDVMLPPTEPAPPVELSDRLVPRVGVERGFEVSRSFDVFARGGYAYQTSVVPERQVGTLLADFDRHFVTLGAGGAWRRPFAPFAALTLDLHAAYSQGVSRTVTSETESGPTRHDTASRSFGAGLELGMSFDARGRGPGGARGAAHSGAPRAAGASN